MTRRAFTALAIGALATLATSQTAEAMPRKFRKCPRVKQNGITYVLYSRCAIVARTPNRATVTIPDTIKHHGKRYQVRAIWDHTFGCTPKLRRIDLKAAHLESIEDPAIWDARPRISVITHDKQTRAWLKSTGAKVIK